MDTQGCKLESGSEISRPTERAHDRRKCVALPLATTGLCEKSAVPERCNAEHVACGAQQMPRCTALVCRFLLLLGEWRQVRASWQKGVRSERNAPMPESDAQTRGGRMLLAIAAMAFTHHRRNWANAAGKLGETWQAVASCLSGHWLNDTSRGRERESDGGDAFRRGPPRRHSAAHGIRSDGPIGQIWLGVDRIF